MKSALQSADAFAEHAFTNTTFAGTENDQFGMPQIQARELFTSNHGTGVVLQLICSGQGQSCLWPQIKVLRLEGNGGVTRLAIGPLSLGVYGAYGPSPLP